MSRLLERLAGELTRLDEASRLRTLRQGEGIDCSSNDYLGLSDHPDVLRSVAEGAAAMVPAGSTGSRLLSGNHPLHEEAECSFARWIGRERSLLFGSGFGANLALLSTLPTRRDLILLDSAAHASLKEGARVSLATKRSFRHNSLDDLRRALHDRASFSDLFIVVEGVYSMDGDRAPLAGLAAIAEEMDGSLIVDEAHSTGLYGASLRGVHELEGITPLVTVHPCGKALGSSGAFIASDGIVIDYLVNNARPFLFSTAPSPLQSLALTSSIGLLPSMGARAAALLESARILRERLASLRGWKVIPSDSPIIPIITGDDRSAVEAARLLQSRGYDIRPIRPPTVPEGTSRLRVSLTSRLSQPEIIGLADAIIEVEEEMYHYE